MVWLGCGGSPPPRPVEAPPAPPPKSDPPRTEAAAAATVSTEVRRNVPKQTTCGDGDVCGFFLQVLSPGSDAVELANKTAKMIQGKCGGHIIVYKDARKVLGAGTVLSSADEKRSCERALGRDKPDTDFPNYTVWQVMK
jgi:hypothetical protein